MSDAVLLSVVLGPVVFIVIHLVRRGSELRPHFARIGYDPTSMLVGVGVCVPILSISLVDGQPAAGVVAAILWGLVAATIVAYVRRRDVSGDV